MTTICAVKKDNQLAMAGDGQITMGQQVIMKGSARKIRRIYHNQVLVGFAGGVADAITLSEMFETKLSEHQGQLTRAAVELAKSWRSDRTLQKLEALLIVMDKENLLMVSGTGEVIEPDDGRLMSSPMTKFEWKKLSKLTCHYNRRDELIMSQLTPRYVVNELNKYIIGQDEAKRAIAIALRNRLRRLKLDPDMQAEVKPKNILMIGPTGVGKTEIARRLAEIANAPFVKVEATKYTEIGYVGRDVEAMVRDLVEASIRMVKKIKHQEVREEAYERALTRLAKALKPGIKQEKKQQAQPNDFMAMLQKMTQSQEEPQEVVTDDIKVSRRQIKEQLRQGLLNDKEVTIELEEKKLQLNNLNPMMEQMMDVQSEFQNLRPKKKIKRSVTVKEALELLTEEESDHLVNQDDINQQALELAQNSGIIFIDEIDKIATSSNHGGEVSRQGVQRDILPIVEGSDVQTKYGIISTDHILFIGSGAFHVAKPSDLIPELQGRFPIRVQLTDLKVDDFRRILQEPAHAILHQYQAMLATEGVEVIFTESAIDKMAEYAVLLNESTDNIGARRLHTIVETVLEELLYEAADMNMGRIEINGAYVSQRLDKIVESPDLSHYIL